MATPVIADNPKKALEDYLGRLRDTYYPWYERSVKLHRRLTLALQLVVSFAGIATASLAALATQQDLMHFGWIRSLLVLLPVLGTGAMHAAVNSKISERYRLREEGRLRIQSVYNQGKISFAAATSAQEYTAIHRDLAKQVNDIESQQSQGFFLLVPVRPQKGDSVR